MLIDELDFLVFEHVFQNEKGYIDWLKNDYLKDKDETFFASPIKNYSSNMTNAWEVVRKMNHRGYYLSLEQDSDLEFDAFFTDGYYEETITVSSSASHEKAEKAICIAALKVLGVEFN